MEVMELSYVIYQLVVPKSTSDILDIAAMAFGQFLVDKRKSNPPAIVY